MLLLHAIFCYFSFNSLQVLNVLILILVASDVNETRRFKAMAWLSKALGFKAKIFGQGLSLVYCTLCSVQHLHETELINTIFVSA